MTYIPCFITNTLKSIASGGQKVKQSPSYPNSVPEEEFYPKSSYDGEGSSFCTCSSPSTTITIASEKLAAMNDKQNYKELNNVELSNISFGSTDELEIQDIELRFDIGILIFFSCFKRAWCKR